MTTSHTPGPWKAEERDSRIYIMSRGVKHPRVNGATWHNVAYLCTSNGCDMSDGRLIAAAPELLDVVKLEDLANDGAISDNERYTIFKKYGWLENNEAWEVWLRNKRHAAIAKAKGE